MSFFKKLTLLIFSFIILTASNAFWKDLNNQLVNIGDAVKQDGVSTIQPTLTQNAVRNKLPGMVFDGTDDYFDFTIGDKLINNAFTIFVVEQRADNSANNYFIGSQGGSQLLLGYKTDGLMVFGVNGTEFEIGIDPFFAAKPVMHIFTHHPVSGKRYYRNGNLVFTSSDTTSLTSYTNPTIGRDNANYYNGAIMEIAIYSRVLEGLELEEIEDYMLSKWNSDNAEVAFGLGCTSASPGFGLNAANSVVNGSSTVASGAAIDIECDSGFTGTPGDLNCNNGVLSGGGGTCVPAAADCNVSSPGYVDPVPLDTGNNDGAWYISAGNKYAPSGIGGDIGDGNQVIFGCGDPGAGIDHDSPNYPPSGVSHLVCSGGTWTGGVGTAECAY